MEQQSSAQTVTGPDPASNKTKHRKDVPIICAIIGFSHLISVLPEGNGTGIEK
jgi:hypothetical protein